jgi:hypothetical protein
MPSYQPFDRDDNGPFSEFRGEIHIQPLTRFPETNNIDRLPTNPRRLDREVINIRRDLGMEAKTNTKHWPEWFKFPFPNEWFPHHSVDVGLLLRVNTSVVDLGRFGILSQPNCVDDLHIAERRLFRAYTMSVVPDEFVKLTPILWYAIRTFAEVEFVT